MQLFKQMREADPTSNEVELFKYALSLAHNGVIAALDVDDPVSSQAGAD